MIDEVNVYAFLQGRYTLIYIETIYVLKMMATIQIESIREVGDVQRRIKVGD